MKTLNGMVAIRPDSPEQVTKSGIYIPFTSQDPVSTGTVVAVPHSWWLGPRLSTRDSPPKEWKVTGVDSSGLKSCRIPMPVEIETDDRVMFREAALEETKSHDGVYFMKYSDLVCKYVDGQPHALGEYIICKEVYQELEKTQSGIILSTIPDAQVSVGIVQSMGYDWDDDAPGLKVGDAIVHSLKMNITLGDNLQRVCFSDVLGIIPEGYSPEEVLAREDARNDIINKIQEIKRRA